VTFQEKNEPVFAHPGHRRGRALGSLFLFEQVPGDGERLRYRHATTIYLIFGIGMTLGTLAGGKFGGMVFKKSDRALLSSVR
jgi:hypothetical protein